MYKIVIADDEPTELKFIRFVINTYKLPFQICGEAENGEDALLLVREHEPDFAILDIQMPLVNGLEAASQIKKEYPATKVYLLTAYELFAYAQKALRADVDDYLLKPIKPEALADVLRKGIEQVVDQLAASRDLDETKKNMEEAIPLLKRQAILELITANQSATLSDSLKNTLGLNGTDFSTVLVASLRTKEGKLLMDKGLRRLIEIMGTADGEFGEILPTGHIVAFFSAWDEKTKQNILKRIESIYPDLESSFYAGCARLKEFAGVPEAYGMAVRLHDAALFWERAGIYRPSDLGVVWGCPLSIVSIEKNIFNCLLERKIDKAKDAFGEVFKVLGEHFVSPEQVTTAVSQILNMLMKDLTEQLLSETDLAQIQQRYSELIASAGTKREMEKTLFELTESIHSRLCLVSETQIEQSIKWATAYIRQNYHEDISLDQLASKLFLSPSYFSRMFKKLAGESFASFVITVRMEQAQALLVTGKYSVTQVSKKVGFLNSGYFSTVYKKHFGLSPQQAMQAGEHRENFLSQN